MGTTVYRATRAQAVADELRDIGIHSDVLARRLFGSRLWVLAQVKLEAPSMWAGTCWISLSLIQVRGPEVVVKRLDETCGPYYYDCPLSFLAKAQQPQGPHTGAWRDKVRAFHAQQALVRQQRRQIQPGAPIRYGGETYQLQRSLGRRGWEVLRERDQCPMRMRSHQFTKSQWLGTGTDQPL
ncbi:MAG: hypothetical protein EOO27_20515 [Comamonadaceae bacterium]|nr:MAG: hypothetical protein EOO27_20515 [Comamonadaceae bacterium]